jgi:hypothetical protein
MGWTRYLVLLLFISLSFAAVIQSGDAGAKFVEDTSAAKCQEPNVQAVYKCSGNVVRVVSTISGQGSTFYKPDGRIIRCPVVSPTQMGAECLQMMTPNYCPTQAKCGNSSAPTVFPGQNDTPEQVGDADYYIVPGQAANDTNKTTSVQLPQLPPVKKPNTTNYTTVSSDNAFEIPIVAKNNLDSPLGYILYIIVFLGICAIGVLFMLFKSSLAEDESN